ncbi:MAG: hypothetical protein M1142_02400 [Patescibacteria group bacterium]|nr:hypothetical protein [Patescibacteria group bacterium]
MKGFEGMEDFLDDKTQDNVQKTDFEEQSPFASKKIFMFYFLREIHEVGFLVGLLILVLISFLLFYFGVPTIMGRIA